MNNIKFGIFITTFNRFEYVFHMLESFKKTYFLKDTIIYINDDASTDSNLKNYLYNYSIDNENITLKKNFNSHNIGSKENYKKSVLNFENENVDFIVNLDSDCILNKFWLIKIEELIQKFGNNILCSSFSCKYHHGNPNNKLHLIEEEYYERDTLNGLGICIPKKLITDFKNDTDLHFDSYLSFILKPKYNLRCICTTKSYIQHIGVFGEHSNLSTFDVSDNFIGE